MPILKTSLQTFDLLHTQVNAVRGQHVKVSRAQLLDLLMDHSTLTKILHGKYLEPEKEGA